MGVGGCWGCDFVCLVKEIVSKYNRISACYLFAHVASVHYAYK